MSKVYDLVEYIVKSLADKPEEVNLSEIEGKLRSCWSYV